MTPTKTAVILIMLAALIPGGVLNYSHAAQATNYIYNGNQLIEIDFDDGRKILYDYDENGNLVSKTHGSSYYTITATSTPAGAGTVSPSGPVNVLNGDNRTFTFIPNSGYYTSNVMVDGASVGAPDGYTFLNVTGPHTISVALNRKSNSTIEKDVPSIIYYRGLA